MRTVHETPTEHSDYALISLTYASLVLGAAASARGRPLIDQKEIIPLSAATFAISKLLVHEKVETWIRSPFVEETPDGKKPKGRRLRYAVGELLSCTRCIGAWSALGLIALRLHAPHTGRVVTTVLAVSAANDFLQTGFSALCAQSNRLEKLEDSLEPPRHPEGRFANRR